MDLVSKETGKVLQSLPVIKALPEHRNYIISTWVKSYEPTTRRLGVTGGTPTPIDKESFRAREAGLAERFWQDSFVIVSGDDSFTIHGWINAESSDGNGQAHGRNEKTTTVRHVYVPPALRHKGIAKGLVQSLATSKYLVSKPWPAGCHPTGHVCSLRM